MVLPGAYTGTLGKHAIEAAQRRASNATFRGSPSNSAASSPTLSTETSRESVSQPLRTPKSTLRTSDAADSTPKYDVHRHISRIPLPASAQTSKPEPFSPGVNSFALTGEHSLSMSTMDEQGASHRQPSCASAPMDLDSAREEEGPDGFFHTGIQHVAQERVGDMNKSVPQSPMMSASVGGSASPDSIPDSAHAKQRAENCTPVKGDTDSDSIASLGSYLELEDDLAQQMHPDNIMSPEPAATDTQPSQSAVGTSFTFSALSQTPTHGSPQNHFFHPASRSAPTAKRKLVFNTPPPKMRNRKHIQKQEPSARLLLRLATIACVICGLTAACWMLARTNVPLGGGVGALIQAGGISAMWREMTAAHAESVSGMWHAVGHMAHRYWVIARFNMGSFLPPSVQTSRLLTGAELESTSVADSFAPADGEEQSANLLSSVSSILHQAKDEASHLLSSALWDGDSARFFGACANAATPAPVDFWRVCSTQNMCMAQSPEAVCDSLCGLFQTSYSSEDASTQSRGLSFLSHASGETSQTLAAGLSMGYAQVITAWDAVKQCTAQGVQFRLPSIHLRSRLQVWLSSAGAEQLRNFVLGRHVDWPSVDITALALLALACCVTVTLLALAAGDLGSTMPATQTKSQEQAGAAKPAEACASPGAVPVTRRKSTWCKKAPPAPAAGPTPTRTASQDPSFCTTRSHGYSLRSRPSPYQARQEVADTAATTSRGR